MHHIKIWLGQSLKIVVKGETVIAIEVGFIDGYSASKLPKYFRFDNDFFG